ncbi:MAG: hypothetical protein KAR36_02995, partial [Candidatus Latescibacteria bacterium]|nr:hypothetical protein [Candidatus Latescibacterota bacterium]
VIIKRGKTMISPLAASSRVAIRERLYTPGELLRLDELEPDLETAQKEAEQLNLFGPPMQESREGA